MIFLGLLRAAKLREGDAAGILRRHAVAKIFFDGQVEMRRHFRLEFAIELIATEKSSEAMEEAKIHGRAPIVQRGVTCTCGRRGPALRPLGSILAQRVRSG